MRSAVRAMPPGMAPYAALLEVADNKVNRAYAGKLADAKALDRVLQKRSAAGWKARAAKKKYRARGTFRACASGS